MGAGPIRPSFSHLQHGDTTMTANTPGQGNPGQSNPKPGQGNPGQGNPKPSQPGQGGQR
jgi:hypothetical protein